MSIERTPDDRARFSADMARIAAHADPIPALVSEREVGDLVVTARGFLIHSADDYRRVAEFLKGIKTLRAEIAAGYDEHIARAFQAHRALVKEKRDREAAAVEAEGIAKALLDAWDHAREAADAEARMSADAEFKAEVDAVLTQAIAAEEAGDYAKADTLLERRATLAPPAVVPTTPKVEGITHRETWHAQIEDLHALIKAAAEHRPWVALLNPNMGALNAQARSLKSRMQIPGVRAVSVRGVAASR